MRGRRTGDRAPDHGYGRNVLRRVTPVLGEPARANGVPPVRDVCLRAGSSCRTDRGVSASVLNFENKMKKIGFLSFGHWTPSPQSQTRSASDALLQSIELSSQPAPTARHYE